MANITTGLQASGTDFIGLDPAMKVIFEEPLTDNIVAYSEMLDCWEQDLAVPVMETDGGRYIDLAHYFQLPGAVGARLENDYMPEATPPKFDNSQIYLKTNYAVIQMSGTAYRRAKQGPGAFISWADRALPDVVRRMTDNIDRQLVGTGQGILARVTDASPSTTVTLGSAYGVSGLTNAYLLFQPGMQVRYSPNADASSPRALVATVNSYAPTGTAGTLTISQLPTSAAQNDYIFPGDANATSGLDGGTLPKELMGLLGIVDDGTVLTTFQGLLRSTYPNQWACISIDSSTGGYGSVLSEELLMQADQDTYQIGNGRPDTLICSRSAWRSFWKTLKGDRMYTRGPTDDMNYIGGAKRLTVDLGDRTLEFRPSRKVPPQVAFGIERASLKRWHNAGFFWDDTTGSIWNRVTDGTGRKDAYYAVGAICMQTGCIAPSHNFLLKNLAAA